MDTPEKSGKDKIFLNNPEIMENYTLLREIGILNYIDSLNKEIKNYKNLFAGALDIFNRITIEDIIEATVWQISDNFLPSLIVFLWKPMQNRDDITIKSYKNYKLVDLSFTVETIGEFEPFFKTYPGPISYELFSREMIQQGKNLENLDKIKPELIIPIVGPSGLYGLVLLGRKTVEDEYSEAEFEIIRQLMSFVSQAIQNHLHYERTLRDEKTGLYNNGFFLSRLEAEIARAKRSETGASVIMIDADKFKNFNDAYGHLAGDRVLEGLAITIKQGVRVEDVPSRFGGEEFTILLPDTGKEEAWLAAERLRTMVAEMKVHWDPPLPQVTISLGVCSFGKDSELSAEEIIRRADEAVYLSKERGRNRTTVWGSGLFEKIRRMNFAGTTT